MSLKRRATLPAAFLFQFGPVLAYPPSLGAAALSITDGTESTLMNFYQNLSLLVLICFPSNDPAFEKTCQIFTGHSISLLPYTTEFRHNDGGLALYNNQPITVASWEGTFEVETLTSSGWMRLIDYPGKTSGHSLIGQPSGAIYLFGGVEFTSGFPLGRNIWEFKNYVWTNVGKLEAGVWKATAVQNGNTILLASLGYGHTEENQIQRIEIEDESIRNVTIIKKLESEPWPKVYLVPSDFCV